MTAPPLWAPTSQGYRYHRACTCAAAASKLSNIDAFAVAALGPFLSLPFHGDHCAHIPTCALVSLCVHSTSSPPLGRRTDRRPQSEVGVGFVFSQADTQTHGSVHLLMPVKWHIVTHLAGLASSPPSNLNPVYKMLILIVSRQYQEHGIHTL
jgi:hypothetical protein